MARQPETSDALLSAHPAPNKRYVLADLPHGTQLHLDDGRRIFKKASATWIDLDTSASFHLQKHGNPLVRKSIDAFPTRILHKVGRSIQVFNPDTMGPDSLLGLTNGASYRKTDMGWVNMDTNRESVWPAGEFYADEVILIPMLSSGGVLGDAGATTTSPTPEPDMSDEPTALSATATTAKTAITRGITMAGCQTINKEGVKLITTRLSKQYPEAQDLLEDELTQRFLQGTLPLVIRFIAETDLGQAHLPQRELVQAWTNYAVEATSYEISADVMGMLVAFIVPFLQDFGSMVEKQAAGLSLVDQATIPKSERELELERELAELRSARATEASAQQAS